MTGSRRETPFDTYLREIQRDSLLTAAEEKALARRIHDDELDVSEQGEAREQLIRRNLRLVVSVAKHWVGRGLALPDLVEDGNLGLIHSVELFDPARGLRFSTYATWWIEQSIRRGIVNSSKTVRIPRHMSQELTRWKNWARAFAQREGREPDAEEVAKAMKGPPARKRLLTRLLRTNAGSSAASVSLDVLFEDAVSVADPRAVQPDLVEFTDTDREELSRGLTGLPPREAEVLRLRYGLGDRDEPMTLRDVGTALSLSRERVRQLEQTAVARLKTVLEGGPKATPSRTLVSQSSGKRTSAKAKRKAP